MLISASPNTGQQGQQNLSVAITGQHTHFLQGTTTASFGAGITVAALTVSSATSATALLDIDPAAAVGGRNVTLTSRDDADKERHDDEQRRSGDVDDRTHDDKRDDRAHGDGRDDRHHDNGRDDRDQESESANTEVVTLANGFTVTSAIAMGLARAIPMTAIVGSPTQITVTVSIPDLSLIATSVNLLQLNADGTTNILGTLHDDGLNGDAFAGDLVFTLVVTLNAPSASQIQLQVSAAFKGALQTVKSPIMNVFFQAANASTVAIAGLAAELASGNISAALLRFLDSDRASAVLSNLTTAGQQRLANAFAAAQLVSSNGDLRVYQLPWIAPNGTVLGLEVALQPNSNGNWVIVSW
jgi:hypothetical protein